MPKVVQVGSDEVEFPDEMSDEDIKAALRRLYPPAPLPSPLAPTTVAAPAAQPRAKAAPRGTPAPSGGPASAPEADFTLGGGPVPVERPMATVQSLAERAAALRLAGENDKAVLVERQIDAMREREKRVAAEGARDAAAQQALAAGRGAAAKADLSARETAAPESRPVGVALQPPEPFKYIPTPGSPADIEDIERVSKERVQKQMELRNLPFSEEEGLLAVERKKEQERRAATISATGGVEQGPTPILPMLRPTRMVETPTFQFPYTEPVGTQRLYRDPDTGELREPTSTERFTEALARQPVMGESEALAVAAEKIEDPASRSAIKNLLTQRIEGEGIIETPLGASLRSLGTLTPAFLNTTFAPILTEGFGVKSTRAAPAAFGADPAAKRRVDETLGYFDQISQGIEQGRGIGDELAQIPALVKATAEATGENEEYARNALWGTGTLSEIFLPITPLGLPGKAASFLGKGAKVVAPAKYAAAAEAGKTITRGIQDRALLGTMARRTYPEAARAIPAFGKEDDIVRIVNRETNIPVDEVRTVLRAQVPDDLVQISDSIAAPKAVASKEREAARKIVAERYRFVDEANRPTPETVAREIDDILVKRSDIPSSGLKKLDDLSVRSLSPTPEGLEPSLFDGIVARTFSAIIRDQDIIPLGPLGLPPVIRPDNALAASIYNRVRNSSFRASQDLRDEILGIAKSIPAGTPVREGRDLLTKRVMDRYFSDPDSFDKLLDKVVEDGLGRVGDVDVKATVKEVAEMQKLLSPLDPARATPLGRIYNIIEAVNDKLPVGGPKVDLDVVRSRLLPIMAATIIEDIAKPAAIRAAKEDLSVLQRGRPARRTEESIQTAAGEAQVSTLTPSGQQWVSGLDSAFKPQDMFEPKALNASWSDSIKNVLEAGAGVRKRLGLYLQSQFGPIPNLPAWTDRFIRGAMISASQVGLSRTGNAATDAYRISNAAPKQVLFVTSDGTRWTPELIASEGKRLGLGLSAQDSARQGAANRVLTQRVQDELVRRAPRLRRAAGALDPLGPDYAALASGVSDAYRQAVFAGGLRAGMRAEDAAALARRSLLDYSKADNFLMEKVTPYFASAAETWESARALGDALARGTNIPIQSIRVENFMNRKEDPFSRQGDASRRAFYSLRFPLGDKQYEVMTLNNPVAWAVEGALGTMAMLDGGVVTINELLKGSETIAGAGAQAALSAAELVGSALLGELEPAAPTVQAAPEAGKLTESEMLALLVHLSEPDGAHPEWRPLIDANLPMDLVNPTKDAVIPGFERTKIWRNVPSDWREKGYIWQRVTDEELSALPERERAAFETLAPVRIYKASPEAKSMLRGIRSALPGVLQDGTRWLASDKAQEIGLTGGTGIPASQPSPSIALAELALRRGTREVGADEKAAIEALRATRSGE